MSVPKTTHRWGMKSVGPFGAAEWRKLNPFLSLEFETVTDRPSRVLTEVVHNSNHCTH